MIIHWFPLLCGLFFGLIPPKLLISSECRYLRFEALWKRVLNKEKVRQRRRRWWKLPLVWIDPMRGYAVATMIGDAFGASPKAGGIHALFPLMATFLVLFVVVWVQTSGRQEQGEILSPSGFLGGMMLALLPLVVALSAIVIGMATAVAMGRFIPGYLVATFMTGCIGYLFMGRSLWLIAYTVLVATPMLLSWLRRSSLVVPVRS